MTSNQPPSARGNEPYCSHCGYNLTGLTESSKCPECGRPLVDVLVRRSGFAVFSKRYRSKATLFGLPVIDIAIGPMPGELRGKARGIIAIGDMAFGGIAIGSMAAGVVAFGGLAIGLFALGGLALGILAGVGGGATGTLAAGGGAVGILASGGGAIGYAAQGGGAFGTFVRDGRTPPGASGPAIFDQYSWFFGQWPPGGLSVMQPMIAVGVLALVAATIIGLAVLIKLWGQQDESTD
jgi:hypothetical protein